MDKWAGLNARPLQAVKIWAVPPLLKIKIFLGYKTRRDYLKICNDDKSVIIDAPQYPEFRPLL